MVQQHEGWRAILPTVSTRFVFAQRHVMSQCFLRRYSSVGFAGLHGVLSPFLFAQTATTCVRSATDELGRLFAPHHDVTVSDLYRLDRISDSLCQVADCAELCRLVHPDAEWRQYAAEAGAKVLSFMAQLNTSTEMIWLVEKLARRPEVRQLLPDERAMIAVLQRDFERSGMRLGADDKHTFVLLSEEQLRWERAFQERSLEGCSASHIVVPSGGARSSDSVLSMSVSSAGRGQVTASDSFPATKANLTRVLTTSACPHTRRSVFLQYHRALKEENAENLLGLLRCRHRLATLLGHRSYAEYCLAGTATESVLGTRSVLEDWIRRQQQQPEGLVYVEPWDELHRGSGSRIEDEDERTFAVATWLDAFFAVAGLLLDLRFSARRAGPGEGWHPSVRVCDVFSTGFHGPVGTIYLDLFSRPGKAALVATQTLATGRQGVNGTYHTPRVAVIMDLSAPLLTRAQASMLWHELGHACHAVVARTAFHHLSGPRTSLDIAEVPSTFFESLLSSGMVSISSAYGKPVYSLCGPSGSSRQTGTGRRRASSVANLWIPAMADLCLHAAADTMTADAAEACWTGAICDAYPGQTVDPQAGLQVYGFSHFSQYGSLYYSYVLAEDVVRRLLHRFSADADSMLAGGKLVHNRIMAVGGTAPPASVLADVLAATTRRWPGMHLERKPWHLSGDGQWTGKP